MIFDRLMCFDRLLKHLPTLLDRFPTFLLVLHHLLCLVFICESSTHFHLPPDSSSHSFHHCLFVHGVVEDEELLPDVNVGSLSEDPQVPSPQELCAAP